MNVNEFKVLLKFQKTICSKDCNEILWICCRNTSFKIELIDCKIVITNTKTNKKVCKLPNGFKLGKCC